MERLLAEIDRAAGQAERMPDEWALDELKRIERRVLDRLRDHRQAVAVRMRTQTGGCGR